MKQVHCIIIYTDEKSLVKFTSNVITSQCDVALQGENGAYGKAGVDGKAGKQGLPGKAGVRGELGVQGETGDPGMPGRDGNRGLPGSPGYEGKRVGLTSRVNSEYLFCNCNHLQIHSYNKCTPGLFFRNIMSLGQGTPFHTNLYGHNPVLKELSELITGNIFFFKLDNGKSCLQSNEHKFIRNEPPYISGIKCDRKSEIAQICHTE